MQNQPPDHLSRAENPQKNVEKKESKVSRTEPDTPRVNDEDVESEGETAGQDRMNNGAAEREVLTNNNIREKEKHGRSEGMTRSKSGDKGEQGKEIGKTRYDHRAAYVSEGCLSTVGMGRADAAALTGWRGERGSWDRSTKRMVRLVVQQQARRRRKHVRVRKTCYTYIKYKRFVTRLLLESLGCPRTVITLSWVFA